MLMDEKLRSTIDKIVQLDKQNQEFSTELRKRLGITSTAVHVSTDTERIKLIEKYLGLDYAVDAKASVVDYSFVKMPDVFSLLVSDNREMMRFRYGTRYHEIDFDEFCRYAHLQTEMLLNYYYDITNNSELESIKNNIKKFNQKAKGLDTADSLSAIPFNVKFWAFCNEVKLAKKLRDEIDNLRNVRNKLSHRNTIKSEFDVEEYRNKLKSSRIPTYDNGKINFDELGKNPNLKAIYDTEFNKEYSNYLFEIWYLTKPFDSIIKTIDGFAKVVNSKIGQ